MSYGSFDFHQRPKEVASDDGGPSKVSLVVRADVAGSLEAILSCLDTYHDDVDGGDVAIDLLDFGVGVVTDTDIALAESFGGAVYAFNVSAPGAEIKAKAERAGVEIKVGK